MTKCYKWRFSYADLGGECEILTSAGMTGAQFDGMCWYLQTIGEDELCKRYGVDRSTLINDILQCGYTLECVEETPEPDFFNDIVARWITPPNDMKIVEQECTACGKTFNLQYKADGLYSYLGKPCECEAPFVPVTGPSLAQWLEAE